MWHCLVFLGQRDQRTSKDEEDALVKRRRRSAPYPHHSATDLGHLSRDDGSRDPSRFTEWKLLPSAGHFRLHSLEGVWQVEGGLGSYSWGWEGNLDLWGISAMHLHAETQERKLATYRTNN